MRKFKVTWINPNLMQLQSSIVEAYDIINVVQNFGSIGIYNASNVTSIVEIPRE